MDAESSFRFSLECVLWHIDEWLSERLIDFLDSKSGLRILEFMIWSQEDNVILAYVFHRYASEL